MDSILARTPGFTKDSSTGRWEGSSAFGITHECTGQTTPHRVVEDSRPASHFLVVVRCTNCRATRKIDGRYAPLLTVEPD